MNVFKEMIFSIYNYKYYPEFLKNRKTKVFGFGLLLVLIYFIITMVLPFAFSQLKTGGFANMLEENVPYFCLEDGILEVEDVIELEEDDMLIYIDTDPDYVFYDIYEDAEYLDDYSQALLIDSEKLIFKDSGELQQFYFEDLDMDFDRDDLLKWIPYAYLFIAIFMVFAFIWDVAVFFFGVLFVALLGMIAASCMKKQLTFGQLYMLGVYSRTLPLLIKALVSFLPFSIPFFFIINFGISLAIIIAAIQQMKEQELTKPLEFTSAAAANHNQSIYCDPKMTNPQKGSQDNNKNDFSWMK